MHHAGGDPNFPVDIRYGLSDAGCTTAIVESYCHPGPYDCPTRAALQATATAWCPVLLIAFLFAVVYRRGARPVVDTRAEPGIDAVEAGPAAIGFLARAFHGLAALQIGADVCSCLALGRLLGQATIPDTVAGAAGFRTGGLCWGDGITAFGGVLLCGPAISIASLNRALSTAHGWGASYLAAVLEGLWRAAMAIFGVGMLAGLLYLLVGATLLVGGPAGYQDIYCWAYTGTSASEWSVACAGYGPCATGRSTHSPAEVPALQALKHSQSSAGKYLSKYHGEESLRYGGNTTHILASWTGTNPCDGSWAGITCSVGMYPAVTGVDLSSNFARCGYSTGNNLDRRCPYLGLVANITSLGRLQHLAHLDFGGVFQTDHASPDFAKGIVVDVLPIIMLPQLTTLDLSGTYMYNGSTCNLDSVDPCYYGQSCCPAFHKRCDPHGVAKSRCRDGDDRAGEE
jgi:hypothetical protein